MDQPMDAAGGDRRDELRVRPATGTPTLPSRLSYDSPGYLPLLKLHLVNTLLTIATLSIWRFWAITRVRRLLWARIRFDGETLEYTGNGLEIFVGFLKVVVLILLPVALAVTALEVALLESALGIADTLSLVYVLGLLWLVALGRYLSFRYRVSRTRWRGIRGRLAGSVGGYLWLTTWTYLLTVVTFGLFKPWMDARRIRYALDGARAGSLPVACGLTGGALFWSWIMAILLWPVTFGLSFFWYRARTFRMTADTTTVGSLRFGFTATGGQHARLWLGNMVLLFGPAVLAGMVVISTSGAVLEAVAGAGDEADWPTLGWVFASTMLPLYVAVAIGYVGLMPIVWERRIRFTCRHLVVLGAVDLDAVRQAAEDPSLAGEGLVGDFDAL